MTDLCGHIDFSNLECLNEQPQHAVANALKQGYREDDGLYLESDTDEQLLINIPFQQKVKLHAISISGPSTTGPKVVKLYANRASMGFSDVDSVPCTCQLQLTPSDLEEGTPQVLKLAKFSNVTLLTVFVESNQTEAEATRVTKIGLLGSAGEVFNVAEIKKQEES